MTVNRKVETSFPVRGTPRGHRDPWDEPDDADELRIRAGTVERMVARQAKRLGRDWQREIRAEQRRSERERKRRGELR
jgi:hypothetical protein